MEAAIRASRQIAPDQESSMKSWLMLVAKLFLQRSRGPRCCMTNARRANLLLAASLVGIFALLMALEAISDQDGISLSELAFEALEFCLVIVIASGMIRLVQWLKKEDEEQQILLHDLQVARAQNLRWQNEARLYLDGSRLAMHVQFQSWGATQAEEEVGRLILKGLSHKQIANVRGTSEATVRQQAQSIYEKSGLSGKAALLSFFLEGLFSSKRGHKADSFGSSGKAVV